MEFANVYRPQNSNSNHNNGSSEKYRLYGNKCSTPSSYTKSSKNTTSSKNQCMGNGKSAFNLSNIKSTNDTQSYKSNQKSTQSTKTNGVSTLKTDSGKINMCVKAGNRQNLCVSTNNRVNPKDVSKSNSAYKYLNEKNNTINSNENKIVIKKCTNTNNETSNSNYGKFYKKVSNQKSKVSTKRNDSTQIKYALLDKPPTIFCTKFQKENNCDINDYWIKPLSYYNISSCPANIMKKKNSTRRVNSYNNYKPYLKNLQQIDYLHPRYESKSLQDVKKINKKYNSVIEHKYKDCFQVPRKSISPLNLCNKEKNSNFIRSQIDGKQSSRKLNTNKTPEVNTFSKCYCDINKYSNDKQNSEHCQIPPTYEHIMNKAKKILSRNSSSEYLPSDNNNDTNKTKCTHSQVYPSQQYFKKDNAIDDCIKKKSRNFKVFSNSNPCNMCENHCLCYSLNCNNAPFKQSQQKNSMKSCVSKENPNNHTGMDGKNIGHCNSLQELYLIHSKYNRNQIEEDSESCKNCFSISSYNKNEQDSCTATSHDERSGQCCVENRRPCSENKTEKNKKDGELCSNFSKSKEHFRRNKGGNSQNIRKRYSNKCKEDRLGDLKNNNSTQCININKYKGTNSCNNSQTLSNEQYVDQHRFTCRKKQKRSVSICEHSKNDYRNNSSDECNYMIPSREKNTEQQRCKQTLENIYHSKNDNYVFSDLIDSYDDDEDSVDNNITTCPLHNAINFRNNNYNDTHSEQLSNNDDDEESEYILDERLFPVKLKNRYNQSQGKCCRSQNNNKREKRTSREFNRDVPIVTLQSNHSFISSKNSSSLCSMKNKKNAFDEKISNLIPTDSIALKYQKRMF